MRARGGADASWQSSEVLPPQWIDLDLRSTDLSVLGKFGVIIADPPWAIHQEVGPVLSCSRELRSLNQPSQLPYGTLTDDEMMRMPVGSMQDEGGLLFLWVTGRAMELGRECLAAWGCVLSSSHTCETRLTAWEQVRED